MSLRSRYENWPSDALQRRFEHEALWDSSLIRIPPPRYDPIIAPLLYSMFTSSAFGFSAATAGFLASAGSAIKAGGGFWECSL